MYQFDRNYDTRQCDENRREYFFWLYQFDRNYDTRQCDKYWNRGFS